MSNSSLVSKSFQPKFTPKLIQSSQHAQSSQGEPKVLNDYKAEYKKIKAKLALLEASPSTSQSPKPFQTNKGPVAKTFDWDEEEVFDDEEMTQVKVLMALVDDKLSVGKNHANNGEWIDFTMKKVNIILSMDEDSDWKTYLKYINIDLKHVSRECQKPKRTKDAAYHREKMLLCKQEEAGIQLNAEQADWRDDTDDDELEDQELEVHYMYMAQLQEVSSDAADSEPIFDAEPLQKVSNNDHYNVFSIESAHPEQFESVLDTYPIEQDAHNDMIVLNFIKSAKSRANSTQE
nr:retrovirus-related Pol polyprotein from transposon TNT 1-94 [Tanacetum cinerariifolium]